MWYCERVGRVRLLYHLVNVGRSTGSQREWRISWITYETWYACSTSTCVVRCAVLESFSWRRRSPTMPCHRCAGTPWRTSRARVPSPDSCRTAAASAASRSAPLRHRTTSSLWSEVHASPGRRANGVVRQLSALIAGSDCESLTAFLLHLYRPGFAVD